MKRTWFLLVPILALGAVAFAGEGVFAQEGPPPPAPELAKFKPMLGNWHGSGTAMMGPPGTPPSPWTCKVTFKPILGGHCIQEEVRVDVQGLEAPLFFKNFHGWDRESKKFIVHEISNEGSSSAHVYWTDDNTLVSVRSTTDKGVPVLTRGVSKITADSYDFRIETLRGAADPIVVVKGVMKRVDTPYAMSAEEAATVLEPPSDMMKKLHGMTGKYTMSGQMVMLPGAPATPISGKESCTALFGGSVLAFHVVGDPLPGAGDFKYEGWSFMTHDAERDCYRMSWVNNVGEVGSVDCRWAGDRQLVTTAATTQFGEPQAMRSTLELSETGAIQKASMDRLHKTSKVERAFFGEYKKDGKD